MKVDGSKDGDTVLVTNGVYAVEEREVDGMWDEYGNALPGGFNRVVVTNPVTLLSVNGPEFTVIHGAEGVRCVYLGNKAHLSGLP